MKQLLWGILLTSLITLVGCGNPPSLPSPTIIPTHTRFSATETLTPLVTPTLYITATLPPTATPIPPAPTATPTPVDIGVLIPLAPLLVSVTQVEMGFADRWFTYLRLDEVPLPRSIAATLFVLDSQTATSWEVTSACLDTYCEFAWTAEGQLLWLENGAVFLADADGQNKRNLNAPSAITEIFGVSPTDIAILRGSNGTDLWRLYLPDGTFDAIPDPQRNRDTIPEFVTQNDLLYFTADTTIAGLAYDITDRTFEGDIQILAIPLQAGAIPTLLAALPRLYYGGRSGPPPPPPILLHGTSYWVVTESAGLEEDNAFQSYIIDLRTQRLEPSENVIGFDNQRYYVAGITLSPDRMGLIASVGTFPPGQPSTLEGGRYLASTSALRNGTFMADDFSFIGWNLNPIAIVLAKREGDIHTLHWQPLQDDIKTLFLPTLQVYGYPTILTTPQVFFFQPSRFESSVVSISPQGVITALANLPIRIKSNFNVDDPWRQRVDPVYATDRHAYYVAGAPNLAEPDEQAYLWRWDVNE
jgi:hypothetical protein